MRKLILCILLLPIAMAAQEITVKGTVLEEESNQPLPGVSVLIKGTATGTITDFDGNFELKAKKNDILVLSYVGMTTQEITVTSQPLNIMMQANVSELDAVVISVGYFDVSKKDLSGAIVQIKDEQLERNRTNSVEQMLQGQVAGVVVNESQFEEQIQC